MVTDLNKWRQQRRTENTAEEIRHLLQKEGFTSTLDSLENIDGMIDYLAQMIDQSREKRGEPSSLTVDHLMGLLISFQNGLKIGTEENQRDKLTTHVTRLQELLRAKRLEELETTINDWLNYLGSFHASSDESVLILAAAQETGRHAAKRLGCNDPTLWNDYIAELLSEIPESVFEKMARMAPESNISAAHRTVVLSHLLKRVASENALPRCLVVVGGRCQEGTKDMPSPFKPDTYDWCGLPEVAYFLFSQCWEERDEGIILTRDATNVSGIELGQYLARQKN